MLSVQSGLVSMAWHLHTMPCMYYVLPAVLLKCRDVQGAPVKVLSHFLGLYLGFSDDPAPENVKNWNVKSFQMSRNNRHRDRSVVQDIYAAIDRFLTSRKSLLKF